MPSARAAAFSSAEEKPSPSRWVKDSVLERQRESQVFAFSFLQSFPQCEISHCSRGQEHTQVVCRYQKTLMISKFPGFVL